MAGKNENADEDFIAYSKKEPITQLNQLKPGDHIAWIRKMGDYEIFEHHAIVIGVNLQAKEITVIEYSGPVRVPIFGPAIQSVGGLGSVQQNVQKIEDLSGVKLYRYLYNRTYYSDQDVVERARSRLGERKFNLITNNCEHFATSCKTGLGFSCQIQCRADKWKGKAGFVPDPHVRRRCLDCEGY